MDAAAAEQPQSPEAAIARIASRIGASATALGREQVPLDAARGRVLAETVRLDRDSPPKANTSPS